MGTAELKDKLHKEIDHSDEKLLKMMYALVAAYQTGADDITDARKKLVLEEREKYMRGEGKSYTWDEVKQMAVNRQKPNGL